MLYQKIPLNLYGACESFSSHFVKYICYSMKAHWPIKSYFNEKKCRQYNLRVVVIIQLIGAWQMSFGGFQMNFLERYIFIYCCISTMLTGIEFRIGQHWFGYWFNTNHYPNRCWPGVIRVFYTQAPLAEFMEGKGKMLWIQYIYIYILVG